MEGKSVIMTDFNKTIIEYLLQCPTIRDNPLYFNAINAKDNNKQVITVANDRAINKPYIDGSVMKRYTFTIIDFRSISYQAIVKNESGGLDNTRISENITEMLDVQGILDWITEMNELRDYPDFGKGYSVDSIQATTDTPTLNGIDTNLTPALAKYSITIQVDYLDFTKTLWR